MSALIDLTGRRFGRLLVLGREGTYYYDDGFVAVPLWRCRCDCGRETVVQGPCLRRGTTRSCGCLQRESMRKRNHDQNRKAEPSSDL